MSDDALIGLNKIIDINLFETFLKGMTGLNEKSLNFYELFLFSFLWVYGMLAIFYCDNKNCSWNNIITSNILVGQMEYFVKSIVSILDISKIVLIVNNLQGLWEYLKINGVNKLQV